MNKEDKRDRTSNEVIADLVKSVRQLYSVPLKHLLNELDAAYERERK